VSRGNVLRQLVAAALYRAPDARPPVPILVLASRGDRLVDAACSVNLARRWNAPIALHPTAGHDLTFDEGPWVASQVQQWLRRI
jgi:pimeloyl-ACP methyl ester carboxylesterase